MKKAVSYIRTSAPMQNAAHSVVAQQDVIDEYAVANGSEVVRTYVDETSESDLPERKRMLDEIGLTDIECILVTHRSRLSRFSADWRAFASCAPSRTSRSLTVRNQGP